jgi:hypothetical protein
MTPSASTFNIDKIRASSDMIEEVDGFTTYFGFCSPGTIGTDTPNWSIMRIIEGDEFPKLTVFEWANGSCAYNLVWNDRANYEYKFKTF